MTYERAEKLVDAVTLFFILTILGLVAWSTSGCATSWPHAEKVRALKAPVMTSLPTAPEPSGKVLVAGEETERVVVVSKGDTLWEIASRDNVYGDPFLWPLLYLTNRDVLLDPDRLEVGTELQIIQLKYELHLWARDRASMTMKYERHIALRGEDELSYLMLGGSR